MNLLFLPVVLVLTFLQFPLMPPVNVQRFESEDECKEAAVLLDNSTRVNIVLTCLVDES